MCGGSKGQSQTSQTQTYQPNPQAAGYINSALQKGSDAANLPFNIPQAPVAGFSGQQQQAFNQIGQAQGQAQPYFNQAQNLFNQSAQGPDISQFFNPYAGAVGAQMQNLFGQQASQNTGQLTQAAGGVGADRIAVGQGNLANQQALAEGQTMASLYAPSLSAAQQQQQIQQGAGYGMANLGQASQNASLQGSQALLGSGGLQQQLSQAQMNSPYQQQLAQAAFPYQQAQFLAGITGSLAPGLGGTTSGQGTSTPAQPSIWSQLLGAGTAAAGAYGSYNDGGGSNGKGSNPSAAGTPGSPYYGPVNSGGYADGGAINPYGFDEGGEVNPFNLPAGFNDKPINVDQESIVPQTKLTPIQPHIPQLNLNPQSGGGGGGMNAGQAIGDVAKIAMMFANRGGAVNPYFADGGVPDDPFGDDKRAVAYNLLHKGIGTRSPDSIPGGEANEANPSPVPSGTVPMPRPYPGGPSPQEAANAVRIDSGAQAADGAPDASLPQNAQPAAGAGNPYAPPSSEPSPALAPAPAPHARNPGFAGSPWAALMAAGLGMMGGTSPFAGVNIGQGGMQGLKALEQQREASQKDTTIDQAAKRLELEAKHHEDQYTRSTPHQEFEMKKPFPIGQRYDPNTGMPMTTYGTYDAKGNIVPAQAPGQASVDAEGKPLKAMHQQIGDAIIKGDQMPTLQGLYKQGPAVRGYLASQGFNLAQAQLEQKAAEKQILSLHGPQMVRYVGLAHGVDTTIDRVNELSNQMKLSGIPLLNSLELKKYIQTEGNSPNGQLATQYQTQVGILKEEFANLANGGYAPTEPAWKLANEQINGNYGMKQLQASLQEVQRAIRYRLHAIPNMDTLGPGSTNRYIGSQQPGGAPAAAPADSSGPVMVNTPADAAALKPGTHYKTPGGQEFIR